nr:MAG TPA: hypothetical protein [Caudoviricetes sp.]
MGAFFVFCPLVADSGFNGAFLCLFFLCRRTFLFSVGHSECPLTGAHFSLRNWCWFGGLIADAALEGSIPNREDKFIHSASETRHILFFFSRSAIRNKPISVGEGVSETCCVPASYPPSDTETLDWASSSL